MLSPYVEHDYNARRSGGFRREGRGKLKGARNWTDKAKAKDIFFKPIFTAEQHSSEEHNFEESPAQEETRIPMRQHFGSCAEYGTVGIYEFIFRWDS